MTLIQNTILLTGLPRAGTTLCCHTLNNYTNVLALHEPLTPSEINISGGKAAAIHHIGQFALRTREQALREGRVISRQKDGMTPENPVSLEISANGLRQMDVALGEIDVRAHIKNSEFLLAIKHNALFTSLLPELSDQFPVYGIVRNPLAVLASWNLVDLPVNNGRIPAGEMFDPELKNRLDSTSDRIERQLQILEWFFAAFAKHLTTRVMRYEDFVVDPTYIGKFLHVQSGHLGAPQPRKSRNAGYDLPLMEMLYKRLVNYGDTIWQFYTREDVDALMASIRNAA